jgi:biotin transport system substrate-specific component
MRPARSRARALVLPALLAALLSASAWVALPVGPVPVTLQTFIVAVVVLVCTPVQAAVAIGVYLLLGAVGVPVFSGAQGGVAALVGPTGGYLVGFWLAGVTGSSVRAVLTPRSSSAPGATSPAPPAADADAAWRVGPAFADAVALAVAFLAIYAPGTAWLALSTGRTLVEAALVGVVPFVVPDAAKAVAAVSVAVALRRAGFAANVGASGGRSGQA